MTVLITMAGLGIRFRDKGYVPPKFRIKARGHTLMYWSLMSLQAFFNQRFIFACLEEEDGDWIRSTAEALSITDVAIAKRSSVSRGQAETAFDALAHAESLQRLWIYNIDTYVHPGAMRPQDLDDAAGCIPVFPCSESNMSFVSYGSGIDVVEVAEKRPISRWATVGLYGFDSAVRFAECYQEAYDHGGIQNTQCERYVAPVYELMLANNERVIAPRLPERSVCVLGTPAQVLAFDPAAQPPFGNLADATAYRPN